MVNLPLLTVHLPRDEQGRFRVKKIATHCRPHIDECFCLWLLRHEPAGKLFVGTANAPLEFWGSGRGTPDGRTIAEHEREGTLVVGLGSSAFDEHPLRGLHPHRLTAASSVLAEALGIADDPVYQPLLDEIALHDSGQRPSDLATMVKLLHEEFPDEPRRVLEWTYVVFRTRVNLQRRFLGPAAQTWRECARVFALRFRQRTIRVGQIALTESNSQIPRVGRARDHGNCDVLLVNGPLAGGQFGNTQLYVRQGLNLPDPARQWVRGTVGQVRATDTLTEIAELLCRLNPRGIRAIAGSRKHDPAVREIAEILDQARHPRDCAWATMAIARLIRLEEFSRQGLSRPNARDPRLIARQQLPDLPHWFVEPTAGWIFNGARSADHIPPSKIPADLLLTFIYQALVPPELRPTTPRVHVANVAASPSPTAEPEPTA